MKYTPLYRNLFFSGICLSVVFYLFFNNAYSFKAIEVGEDRANMSKEAELYFREVFKIIKTNSLKRKDVDWGKLEKEAFQLAATAQKTSDTYFAIRFILSKLGDNHSRFFEPTPSVGEEESQLSFSGIKGEMLPHKIAYILVPGFNDQGEKANKFSFKINKLIRELSNQTPCGWIIDLRHNGGGNMWPMIAGLIPFLKEGKLGSSIDSSGKEINWGYRKGKVFEGTRVETTLPPDALQTLPNTPYAAILIGPETASAAEAVAIDFKNRPHTRFFGQKTAGLATSNQYFLLKDGAELLITVAHFADRNKKIYKTGIFPDELVVDEIGKEDSSIKKATKWLLDQSICKK